jgi:GR25 family glycosyltransferase involved in LPS biosynthesis
MDRIGGIVYLNLDKRTDRREQIEDVLVNQLSLPKDKIHRYAAISTSSGWMGCTISHRNIIQMAKDKGWESVLVFEDDFEPTVDPDTFRQRLGGFLESDEPFDALLLAYHCIHEHPTSSLPSAYETWGLRKTTCSQAASAYLLHSRFYDTLLANFSEAVSYIEKGHWEHWIYAADQYWKRLQADLQNTFLIFKPRMGKQRAGHSDLTGQHQDYGI